MVSLVWAVSLVTIVGTGLVGLLAYYKVKQAAKLTHVLTVNTKTKKGKLIKRELAGDAFTVEVGKKRKARIPLDGDAFIQTPIGPFLVVDVTPGQGVPVDLAGTEQIEIEGRPYMFPTKDSYQKNGEILEEHWRDISLMNVQKAHQVKEQWWETFKSLIMIAGGLSAVATMFIVMHQFKII